MIATLVTWRKSAILSTCLVGSGLMVILTGCANPGQQLADLPESLSFTGGLNGTLQRGLNVHKEFNQFPGASMTRCAEWTHRPDFGGEPEPPTALYDAVIVGTVGETAITVFIEVRKDIGAYQHPGTSSSVHGLDIQLMKPSATSGQGLAVSHDKAQPEGLLTFAPDHKSGTLDAWFGSRVGTLPPPSEPPNTTHVYGTWRCG